MNRMKASTTTTPLSASSSAALVPRTATWGKNEITAGDNHYVLEEIIGQTEASRVYKAHERIHPEQKLALKIMLLNAHATLNDLSAYVDVQERIRTYRNIRHEGIATFIDFFTLEQGMLDLPVVVREYIEGESLQQRVENGYLFPPQEAEQLLRKLLEAAAYLETAATQEIVDRDIKPSNIIINAENEPILTDLELCTTSGKSTTGGRGTIAYMPSEQLIGGTPSSMWDRYAIAKTMEQVLTGKEPEHGKPVEFNGGIRASSSLKTILYRMTHPLPEQRYLSALPILDELGQAEGNTSTLELAAHQQAAYSPLVEYVGRQVSLNLLHDEVRKINANLEKVDFGEDDAKEKETLGRFCQDASSFSPSDHTLPLYYYAARGMRLMLEALAGISKNEEFEETIERLAKCAKYEVYDRRESGYYCRYKIIFVNNDGPEIEIVRVLDSHIVHYNRLRRDVPLDTFLKHYDSYAKGWDPELEGKIANKVETANVADVGGKIMGIGGGVLSMIFLGIYSLPLAFGALGAVSILTFAGCHYACKKYEEKAWEKGEKENATIPDARAAHTYNRPSTLIDAFLPRRHKP